MANVEHATVDIHTTHSREMDMNNWTDTYVNLNQLCRICGTHNDYLIPIFDGEGLEHRLDSKIRIHLPIQVMRDDIFPIHLCYNCASTIMSWHALFNNCREADQKFRSLLGLKTTQIGNETELHLASSSHTPSELELDSAEHALVTVSTTHSQLDMSTATTTHNHTMGTADPNLSQRENLTVPLAMMPDGSVHSYSIPEQSGVLDSMISSNITAGLTASMSTNIVAGVPSVMNSDVTTHTLHQPVLVMDAGTQTEKASQDFSHGDIPECALLVAQKSGRKKKGTKIRVVVVKKKRKKNMDNTVDTCSSEQLQRGLFFLQEQEALLSFAAPSRVSAIQSTNVSCSESQTNDADNRTSRWKSVLVRNEAVPIDQFDAGKRLLLPEQSIPPAEESFTNSEHNAGFSNTPVNNGSLVSAVRPTCLRRAPTKFEMSGREHEEMVDDLEPDFELQSKLYFPTSDNYAHSQEAYDGVIMESSPGHSPSPDSRLDEDKSADPSRMCFHCGKVINNIVLLHAHERSHLSDPSPPTSFSCKFCSHPFVTFTEMQSHHMQHEAEAERQNKHHASRRVFLCKQCGQMCTTEERLLHHQKTHMDGTELHAHECKTCGQTFHTRSKLSVHLWSHAVKQSHKTFKCHICGKGFMTKSAVLEHRLKHTEQERSCAFKCVVCGMAFGNNTQLGKHRATHTEEELSRPYKCSFCGKAFARNYTLQIHHLTHSEEKSHLCSQCGKGFKMRNSLMQHMRTHQDPSTWPSFPCHLCRKTFRVKSRLRDHLRMHSGDKPYECKSCGKCFHKVTALHTHEVSHTERRPYMCDICGKAFKWSKNLRQHKAVHGNADGNSQGLQINSKPKKRSKSQPCQCEVCGKQLAGKSSLRQHMTNIHSSGIRKQSQPTTCPVCGKVLSSHGGLVRHLKITHSGIKAFKCDICDRDYSTKVARDDHRRSHTGERPFVCNVCPKTFTSLSNLHIHRTIHSDERPHKCSYCDKQFKRKAHLILHTRTHTGEKPYVCNICNRGFAQSNDLHKHRLTHSNDKAYACHCGMAYRLKRDLTRHQFKHHPPLVVPAEQQILLNPPSMLPSQTQIKHQSMPLLPSQALLDVDTTQLCPSLSNSSIVQTNYVPSVLVRNPDGNTVPELRNFS